MNPNPYGMPGPGDLGLGDHYAEQERDFALQCEADRLTSDDDWRLATLDDLLAEDYEGRAAATILEALDAWPTIERMAEHEPAREVIQRLYRALKPWNDAMGDAALSQAQRKLDAVADDAADA